MSGTRQLLSSLHHGSVWDGCTSVKLSAENVSFYISFMVNTPAPLAKHTDNSTWDRGGFQAGMALFSPVFRVICRLFSVLVVAAGRQSDPGSPVLCNICGVEAALLYNVRDQVVAVLYSKSPHYVYTLQAPRGRVPFTPYNNRGGGGWLGAATKAKVKNLNT